MAVKLRLKRLGRKNHAFYRLNAIDSRSPRDGRVIEELGFYDPTNKDKAKQFTAKIEAGCILGWFCLPCATGGAYGLG